MYQQYLRGADEALPGLCEINVGVLMGSSNCEWSQGLFIVY